jgi:hypothetical protein
VSGANHFVVLPTLTITFFPITVGIEQLAMSIGKSFALLFEVTKPVKKFAHRGSPDVEPGGSSGKVDIAKTAGTVTRA